MIIPITQLQAVDLTSSEVFDILEDLKFKLRQKVDKQYFGSAVNKGMQDLSLSVCLEVLARTIRYLNKYQTESLRYLSILNISKKNSNNYRDCHVM